MEVHHKCERRRRSLIASRTPNLGPGKRKYIVAFLVGLLLLTLLFCIAWTLRGDRFYTSGIHTTRSLMKPASPQTYLLEILGYYWVTALLIPQYWVWTDSWVITIPPTPVRKLLLLGLSWFASDCSEFEQGRSLDFVADVRRLIRVEAWCLD